MEKMFELSQHCKSYSTSIDSVDIINGPREILYY